MDIMVVLLWIAGVLQLLIASANLGAVRKFEYCANLARVSPIVRHVFIVQNIYIVLVVVAFALLCITCADELTAGATPVARYLSRFLSLFWGLRLVIQVFFYDTALRRENRAIDLLFVGAFAYLTLVFAAAARVLVTSLP